MKRRTEITIETDRLVALGSQVRHAENTSHESHPKPFIWCFSCANYVKPLTTDEAAIQGHVSSRTIFHWVELGLVHFIESSDGLLLICANSI
jgi:hypothetical protein